MKAAVLRREQLAWEVGKAQQMASFQPGYPLMDPHCFDRENPTYLRIYYPSNVISPAVGSTTQPTLNPLNMQHRFTGSFEEQMVLPQVYQQGVSNPFEAHPYVAQTEPINGQIVHPPAAQRIVTNPFDERSHGVQPQPSQEQKVQPPDGQQKVTTPFEAQPNTAKPETKKTFAFDNFQYVGPISVVMAALTF